MSRNLANRFSTIQSDPLRSFRFFANFYPSHSDNSAPFDPRIVNSSTKGGLPANGTSSGFTGGFTQIAGLQMAIQDIMYREGGMNTTSHHMPGQATFTPVVFQRGTLYGNDQAITWMQGLFAAAAGSGIGSAKDVSSAGRNYRVDVEIFVADHPNNQTNIDRFGIRLHNAYISSLAFSDLNAGPNEVLFETMTLVHEGMEVFFTKSDGTPLSTSGITSWT